MIIKGGKAYTTMIHHICQEPGDVGTAGEAKDVNLVAWIIEAHEEFVASDNMVIERGPYGAVFGLFLTLIKC